MRYWKCLVVLLVVLSFAAVGYSAYPTGTDHMHSDREPPENWVVEYADADEDGKIEIDGWWPYGQCFVGGEETTAGNKTWTTSYTYLDYCVPACTWMKTTTITITGDRYMVVTSDLEWQNPPGGWVLMSQKTETGDVVDP
jgi:hypothetical protein